MRARIDDAGTLRAISPQSLIAYAVAEGWAPIESFGAHSQVYGKDGSEIIIPGTSKIGDYASVVSELLVEFAKFENRGELQVYRDLSTADKDVVRVRLPEAEANGAIHISAGVDLVVHARDLILSAACAAWSPQPTYRAGKVRQADEYMNRVLMGQTEQGSFVVTLLAPVPPVVIETMSWPKEDQEPFDRRVTRRLASGLDAAADAIERYNLGAGPSVFQSAVKQGLSANLCEAAASLGSREGEVEVSVTWAKTRRTPEPRWRRAFTRADSEMLLEVARIFRDRRARPDEHIEGVIVKLAREDEQDNGSISMRCLIDDRLTSVKATLRKNDYDKAIQAHKGNHVISMNGTLERVGSRWWLTNPVEVEVVYDDADSDDPNLSEDPTRA